MKDNMKMCSFRLTSDDIYKLDMLSTMSGESKSDVVRNLICASYDKINDSEDLKNTLTELKRIQEILSNLHKKI